MGVYIVLWALCLLGSLYRVNTETPRGKSEVVNQLFQFGSFAMMVFIIGFRWQTGTDWNAYLDFYNEASDVPFSELAQRFEPGYVLFNKAVLWLSTDYTVFLVIHALVFFGLVFGALAFFNKNVALTSGLFFALNIGVTGANRQLISVALIFYGLTYLAQGKRLKFTIVTVAAIFFHTSAVFGLLFLVLGRRYNPWLLAGVIGVAFLVGLTPLPQFLFQLSGGLSAGAESRADHYSSIDVTERVTITGIIKRLVLCIIFIWLQHRVAGFRKNFPLLLNVYVLGVALYFFFLNVPVIIARGLLYFNITEPLLMAELLGIFKLRRKLLLVGVYSVMAIFYFAKSISIYPQLFLPYKGIFINKSYNRGI